MTRLLLHTASVIMPSSPLLRLAVSKSSHPVADLALAALTNSWVAVGRALPIAWPSSTTLRVAQHFPLHTAQHYLALAQPRTRTHSAYALTVRQTCGVVCTFLDAICASSLFTSAIRGLVAGSAAPRGPFQSSPIPLSPTSTPALSLSLFLHSSFFGGEG